MRLPTMAVAALALGFASGCTEPPPAPTASSQTATQPGMPGTPIEFRVVADSGNPSSCQRFDAALSRVHTLTRTGATASLTSAGGISSTMTQTAPNVFMTNYSLGTTTLNVVADASTSPKTLQVREAKLGCRWHAVAP